MRKILKYRMLWIVLAMSLGLILLYSLGFRITYNPDLISDWNAVSGCAAWAGVVTSVVAVVYAIRVPKEIADRQDKIALFEKRLAIYEALQNCRALSNHVCNFSDKQTIEVYFLVCFQKRKITEENADRIHDLCLAYFLGNDCLLQTAQFLFDFDVQPIIEPISQALAELILLDPAKCDYSSCRYNFLKAVGKMDDDFMEKIEASLSLTK